MSVASQIDHHPAENWDEDFEFNAHPDLHSTSNSHPPPATSSVRPSSAHAPALPSPPSTPSRNKKSAPKTWAEPGPSTPLKRLQQTENWDDDFQDADSPGPSTRHPSQPQSHAHAQPSRNGQSQPRGGSDSPVENWDEEFESGHPQTRTSPRRRTPRKRHSWGSSDDEDDFGFADREDDRTVTSKSRGMHFHIPAEIPPPVPPLPSPFPRSPTASVFSVPVSSTGRDSSAGYSYSSTAHLALRPTVSGSSAAVAARLALLPPSPPIHRERRRLRKKSRPPPNFEEGIFELDDRAEYPEPPRPVTPDNSKKPFPVAVDDISADIGNTSTTKTPLLSRIGSVGKKWGTARKKRASTGPSEVPLQERDEPPISHDRDRYADSGASRPTSFIASSSPGHGGSKNWFFRGGGGGQGPGSPSQGEAHLKHETSVERLLHLMGVERGRDREPGSPSSAYDRKSKVRSAHTRDGTGSSTLPEDLQEALNADGTRVPTSATLFGGAADAGTPIRPTSMQVSVTNSSSGSSWSTRPPVPRHVSYGDGRYRRPTTPSSRASSKQRSASASAEDVHRAKKSSSTFDDRSSDAHAPTEVEKGSRRFMGGIRRISLGGSKHKRGKSIAADEKAHTPQRPGAALSNQEVDASHDQSTPRPPSRTIRSSHDLPLLPPIELQPPSPPRNKAARRPAQLDDAFTATPTRHSLERTLEPSRSHPTLSARSPGALPVSNSQEIPPIPSPLPSPTRAKPSASPVQTASLGRTAQPPKEREPLNSSVLRRNSLGDLKIPARISQAQVSLRRDLTMVRDFATSVEQLKQLQLTYALLVSRARELINDPQESQSRPVSPTYFHLPKTSMRSRANTNPTTNNGLSRGQFNTTFLSIEAKYRLSWECAELLIDLAGGGADGPTSPPPSSSQSAPVVPTTTEGRKSRERAITLAGDEQKPLISPSAHGSATSPPLASPPPSQWRASTGRHDLSQRQLMLLREMLNNEDPSATMSMVHDIPEEEINRNWRWGDAMNSTVTLPSEESGSVHGMQSSSAGKKDTARRGMHRIREMLRKLKKNPGQVMVNTTASVSASTDSSLNLPRESRPQSAMSRRRAKTSAGPESVSSRRDVHPNSPYGTTPSLKPKSSPRRPSLASIFRIGTKTKSTTGTGQSMDDVSSNTTGLPSSGSGQASGASLGDEEDWDRIDSVSDLDHAARTLGLSSDGTATVRGKKGKSPYLFQPRTSDADTAHGGPGGSQSSIWTPGEPPQKPSAIPPSILESYTRSIKLSDVREHESGDDQGHSARAPSRSKKRQSAPSPSPRRPPSRGNRKNPSGSVRSAPPQPWGDPSPDMSSGPLLDMKLAMAPENIKPLLENAREVHARCADCISELEALLASGINASV